ncbi:MAG: hypothetical protein DRQ88_07325 [Epsilonproteobacteria bacterium]|nr:MAG: hypothetical protein DRQ89_07760 [Campylobacterota bacterium]RLA66210.1 MAG: hypothetical protein DRQ88_07325 [Campylobacterota bacterium]
MLLRTVLALTLFLSLCSAYGNEIPSEINVRSSFHQKVLISNPHQLEKLGLFGTDFRSQEYLDEMLAHFWEGLEFNNYYLVFHKTLKGTSRDLSQIRSETQTLKGYIRVSKWDEKCSTYQALNYSVIKHGQGLASTLRGICGKIATAHSLKKLGLMKKPFHGAYIKENKLAEITLKRQKKKGGMTSSELALAHKKYTGKSCKIQHHVCHLDTRRIPSQQKEIIEKLAKRGIKKFIAKLYKKMNNLEQKYACSLGMISYSSEGERKFSHTEHITKVAINPRTKKIIVVTKNGMVQGDMKKTVPSHAGFNTFSIDPEKLQCYFQKSSHRAINSIYQGISLNQIESICCPL